MKIIRTFLKSHSSFMFTPIPKISGGDKASLAKMMASLSKGSTSFTNDMTGNNNNNNNENDYEEDSFDEDSDEEEEEEEGRALSETGTYVLDKEEEEKQKVGTMVKGDKVAMVK